MNGAKVRGTGCIHDASSTIGADNLRHFFVYEDGKGRCKNCNKSSRRARDGEDCTGEWKFKITLAELSRGKVKHDEEFTVDQLMICMAIDASHLVSATTDKDDGHVEIYHSTIAYLKDRIMKVTGWTEEQLNDAFAIIYGNNMPKVKPE